MAKKTVAKKKSVRTKKRVAAKAKPPRQAFVAPKQTVLAAADVAPVGRPWPTKNELHIGEILGENGKPNYRLLQLLNDDGSPVTVTGRWGEYGKKIPGADSIRDGLANTEAMLAAGSEVAKAARKYGDDCHIPAIGELGLIRTNNPNCPTSGAYWSSTQGDAIYAWYQSFGNGNQYWNNKNYKFSAFVVRRVEIKQAE